MLRRFKEARAEAQEKKRREVAALEVKRLEQSVQVARSALELAKLEHRLERPSGVQLKASETVFMTIAGVGLIEPRRAPSKWVGGSQGVSFRVAKGVSYRVGATRGHLVQGEETPTLIDKGTAVITDQRIIFLGSKRTTEWAFSKLLGFSLDDEAMAIFNVSNRQKASGLLYGKVNDSDVDAVLSAAIARFTSSDDHQAVVESYAEALRKVETQLDNVLSQSAKPPSGIGQLPPPSSSEE